jgi:transposase-like protein
MTKRTGRSTTRNANNHKPLLPPVSWQKLKRNGKKRSRKQNYRRKGCGRRFTTKAEKSCKGCLNGIDGPVKRMFVRVSGIRDPSFVPGISIKKVLKILAASITI